MDFLYINYKKVPQFLLLIIKCCLCFCKPENIWMIIWKCLISNVYVYKKIWTLVTVRNGEKPVESVKMKENSDF